MGKGHHKGKGKKGKGKGTTSVWDCDKVVAEVARCLSSSREDRLFVVLVLSGALNPVHRGHTEMLRRSKELVEQVRSVEGRAVVVVGFALAPSSESYVNRKLGFQAISLKERVFMCEAASLSDPLTCVVPFGFASGQRTADQMRPCLDMRLRGALEQVGPVDFDFARDLDILPVYGSDYLVRCPQTVRMPALITCRQDEDDTAQVAKQIVAAEFRPHPSFHLLEVEAGAIPDFSSTAVRKAQEVLLQAARLPEAAVIDAWSYLHRALHPEVFGLLGLDLPK